MELRKISYDKLVGYPVTGIDTFFAREQAIGASNAVEQVAKWFEATSHEVSEIIKKRKK